MKNLFSFLFRYSPGLVALGALISVISGAFHIGMIALINTGIAQFRENPPLLIWLYIGACFLFPVTRIISQIIIANLTQKAVFDLRMHLSRQILAVPLRNTEKLGSNKLLASLTTDVNVISNALPMVSVLFMQLTIVIGAIIYLFVLYVPAGVGVILAIIVGVTLYMAIANRAMKHYAEARTQQNELFTHFEALTQGTKELKLHRRRRLAFLEDSLQDTASIFRRQLIQGITYFAGAGSLGTLFFFIAIGVCIFWLPTYDPALEVTVATGFTMTLLFLIVPLEGLTSLGPIFGNAAISLERVSQLGVSLDELNVEAQSGGPVKQTWSRLEFDGITHQYHREKENETFTMGPINLSFEPGELVFIVGGNGSGKTTLAKMLLGLYFPETGEVRLDGVPITDENRDAFRQLFTGVFSDFFLFETLLGLEGDQLDEKAKSYLERLQLDHKVKVKEGSLSTVNLSQGQRKRLALLTAYLEDRPIYLFDEWAADQDPYFKDIFYKVLLPELKNRGKTVMVISHDDHYYGVADRIIKIDYGQIEFDRAQSEMPDKANSRA